MGVPTHTQPLPTRKVKQQQCTTVPFFLADPSTDRYWKAALSRVRPFWVNAKCWWFFLWHSYWVWCLYRTIARLAIKMPKGRFHSVSPTAFLLMILAKIHSHKSLQQGPQSELRWKNLSFVNLTGMKTAPAQSTMTFCSARAKLWKAESGLDRWACWVIRAGEPQPPSDGERMHCVHVLTWLWMRITNSYCSKPTFGKETDIGVKWHLMKQTTEREQYNKTKGEGEESQQRLVKNKIEHHERKREKEETSFCEKWS